ncbi:MAG: calcium/sodium antiporter [Flavobacteriaceae bacterium]|jgi:cation:H+ antiporter|nr:calcium/sodium antiporter [Flavobacteriaceae bacterium]MBT4112960.1 calcium/sodium antiporter [Flavobacteriaceae bacterium]MBT4245881.1 calcium/sodium antiporter [Flavobacteriaceae bacterium]MBT4614582.1 calcium/sodium antiporter [Flavobacteriaceae bacterium]MBT5246190.1 calcium/sodium antiporter [Flavobacteriaceae bacterium]
MNLLWMFIGFILLVIGGEFIIRASVALSLKLNISKLVIGMTVVAFATSLPELIVSISAAINDSPSIAINNVIGSNIANIGLVLGLTCIIGNMYVEKSFYKIDWPVMFIFSIILYFIIARDNIIDQYDGIVLFSLLIVFIIFILRSSLKTYQKDSIDNNLIHSTNFKTIVWIIIASVSLFYGAEWLVYGAINFAEQIGVSEAVISVSIIAVGTSIPELATSLLAIVKNEKGISLGNLIGSNIFNIGSVIGITSMIKPIVIDDIQILNRDIIWMLVFALLILLIALFPKKNVIGKIKGFFLLFLYSIFILLSFVS